MAKFNLWATQRSIDVHAHAFVHGCATDLGQVKSPAFFFTIYPFLPYIGVVIPIFRPFNIRRGAL